MSVDSIALVAKDLNRFARVVTEDFDAESDSDLIKVGEGSVPWSRQDMFAKEAF